MKIDCKKPPLCSPDVPPKEIWPPATAPFSFCVGGMTVYWDGTRLRHEPGVRVPDGTYDTVTVVNNCIVGYGYAAEATYTPPYCNPNPGDCQQPPHGGGGGGAAPGVSISPDPANLIRSTGQGLLAKVHVTAGDGVSVSGNGVASNPFVISARSVASRTVVGRNGVRSVPEGNDVVYMELEGTGVTPGVYNGVTIDRYGRVTDVEDNALEINVSHGDGLTSRKEGDTTIIGHPTFQLAEQARFGGYNVTINSSGHITHMERDSNVKEGVYRLGAYKIGLERSGSITSIAQDPAVPDAPGKFTTTDGKTISYDDTGRITAVEAPALGVTPPPLPVRDMYRLTIKLNPTTATVDKEAYGQDLLITEISPSEVVMILPDYVVDAAQVNVQGALGGSVDIIQRRLHITYSHGGPRDGERVVTVALRA